MAQHAVLLDVVSPGFFRVMARFTRKKAKKTRNAQPAFPEPTGICHFSSIGMNLGTRNNQRRTPEQ
jgi:hypothetical protein